MTGAGQVWVLVAHEIRRRWRSLLIWEWLWEPWALCT